MSTSGGSTKLPTGLKRPHLASSSSSSSSSTVPLTTLSQLGSFKRNKTSHPKPKPSLQRERPPIKLKTSLEDSFPSTSWTNFPFHNKTLPHRGGTPRLRRKVEERDADGEQPWTSWLRRVPKLQREEEEKEKKHKGKQVMMIEDVKEEEEEVLVPEKQWESPSGCSTASTGIDEPTPQPFDPFFPSASTYCYPSPTIPTGPASSRPLSQPQHFRSHTVDRSISSQWTIIHLSGLLSTIPDEDIWKMVTPPHLPRPIACRITRPPSATDFAPTFLAYEKKRDADVALAGLNFRYDEGRAVRASLSNKPASVIGWDVMELAEQWDLKLERFESIMMSGIEQEYVKVAESAPVPPELLLNNLTLEINNLPRTITREALVKWLPRDIILGVGLTRSNPSSSSSSSSFPPHPPAYVLCDSRFELQQLRKALVEETYPGMNRSVAFIEKSKPQPWTWDEMLPEWVENHKAFLVKGGGGGGGGGAVKVKDRVKVEDSEVELPKPVDVARNSRQPPPPPRPPFLTGSAPRSALPPQSSIAPQSQQRNQSSSQNNDNHRQPLNQSVLNALLAELQKSNPTTSTTSSSFNISPHPLTTGHTGNIITYQAQFDPRRRPKKT